MFTLRKQYITVDNSSILLYTVYNKGVVNHMNLIINNTSMQPIYEQIVGQIKEQIMNGALKQDAALPSVRILAKDLRISALTVKKAYDALEQEGFIITVHGKGSFVARVNPQIVAEEGRKEVEKALESAIRLGKSNGMSVEEIQELFSLIIEDF